MDKLLAVILLAAIVLLAVTWFVPVRVPVSGKFATRIAVYFHKGAFTAIPMVAGGAAEVLQATLGAVAAAGGTTVPAELGRLPANEAEGIWTLQSVTVESPTLVTGATATAGTINIRQLRQNGLATMPVSAGGSGYTSVPVVAIGLPTGLAPGTAMGVGQRQATAHAVLTAQAVSSYVIDDPGAGYTAAPVITVTGGGGTGATCTSPTVGQVVVGTLASLALITGVNLPAEAPVNIPLTAPPISPLLAGDVLDVQYVQISTGTALVAGTKVEAEVI